MGLFTKCFFMPSENLRPTTSGFRVSWRDAVVMLAVLIATYVMWRPLPRLSLLLPVVLGHFFLFCNVFRLRRTYELAWSGIFLVNVSLWLLLHEYSWIAVVALQMPATVAVIALELRSSRYHGILWRRVNPNCRKRLGPTYPL